MQIHRSVSIGARVTIQGGGLLGEHCVIGDGCTLKIGATLTAYTVLGRDCRIGPFAVCQGADGAPHRPTVLGDRVKLGSHADVAPGVHICDDVEIGAYSYVTRDITEPGTYKGRRAGLRRVK